MKRTNEILTLPCGTEVESSSLFPIHSIYNSKGICVGDLSNDFIELFDELLEVRIRMLNIYILGNIYKWDDVKGWV